MRTRSWWVVSSLLCIVGTVPCFSNTRFPMQTRVKGVDIVGVLHKSTDGELPCSFFFKDVRTVSSLTTMP